ncbi:MAG: DUF5675 family protein [Cyclobacteriaceae bacterium]
MKRILLLLAVAIGTFLIILFFKNPDMLEGIWLWALGLIGLIIKGGRIAWEKTIKLFDSLLPETQKETVPSKSSKIESKIEADIELTVLRYFHDKDTTLGLLYINGAFFCYTLEDTFNQPKVPGQTRIWSGEYFVDFRREETELTKTYKSRYPEWFQYHLWVKDVPEFSAIYIHSGGDNTDTEGCILVSDSLSVKADSQFFTNSRNTFKRLYLYLMAELDNNKKIKISIHDEAWFGKAGFNHN